MKWMKKSILILFCLIASVSSAAMLVSGSFNLNRFYDVGEIYDYSESHYSNWKNDSGYCDAYGKFTITGSWYVFYLYSETVQENAEYIYIDVAGLNKENLVLRAEYLNEKISNEVQREELYTIYNGRNCLKTYGQDFNVVRFVVENQQGVSFSIKSVQAREKIIAHSVLEFILYASVFMGLYLLGVFLILKTKFPKKTKNILDKTIDTLQDIYVCVGNNFINVCPKIIKKYRNVLDIIIFSGMMLYMNLIEDIGKYAKYLDFHFLFYAICLLVIAIMHIDTELKRKNWKNGLVYSWILYWILVCISDYKVEKQYQFAGYIGIFVIGFLIFVWNNCKDRTVILQNFIKSIHLYFWICYSVCVVFRPLHEGQRYLGISWNPIIFATCMVTVFAVVLAELDNFLLGLGCKKMFWLYAVELGCVIELIWATQSTGPILTCFLITLIWLARVTVYIKKNKVKSSDLKWGTLIIAMIIGGFLTKILITVVPGALGTEIILQKDLYCKVPKLNVTLSVYAADLVNNIKESRIYNKLFESQSISALLTNRNYFYNAYLREMNLWGHKGWTKVFGKTGLPHNALIGIAFKYGVFTVIPYLYMLLYTLKGAYKKIFENQRYSFVVFAVSFTSIVISMVDNAERPFIWCTWLALYILMGDLFCEKDNKL